MVGHDRGQGVGPFQEVVHLTKQASSPLEARGRVGILKAVAGYEDTGCMEGAVGCHLGVMELGESNGMGR